MTATKEPEPVYFELIWKLNKDLFTDHHYLMKCFHIIRCEIQINQQLFDKFIREAKQNSKLEVLIFGSHIPSIVLQMENRLISLGINCYIRRLTERPK